MTFDQLTRDDLLEIQISTGIDLISIYESISDFMKTEAIRIRNFFDGTLDSVVAQEFKKLDLLVDRTQRTVNDLINAKEQLNLYSSWVALEDLEDSLLSLQTLQNYSLWSRSNRNINIFAGNVELDYLQKQEQTLEDIEIESGSSNPDISWYQTAIRNQLREEDYSSAGGIPLKIILKNSPSAFLESVIDQIDNGLKSYGIDLDKKIQFNNNDLRILGNRNTLLQSAEILLNLKKGDNPSLPSIGIDQVSILGSSKGSFLFPLIFRQLIEIFSTDDTFGSVEVGQIKFEQDAVFINVQVSSRYKETIDGLIQI